MLENDRNGPVFRQCLSPIPKISLSPPAGKRLPGTDRPRLQKRFDAVQGMEGHRIRRARRRTAALFLLLVTAAVGAETFSGIGFVQPDGTLRVAGRTVHLWGIYLPLEHETCFRFLRPVRCGSAAVLALELKIDGFVRCRAQAVREDRGVEAICRTDGLPFSEGEDLAAFLLRNGWALARPEAPFEYHALERIARHRNLGVWGIPGRRR